MISVLVSLLLTLRGLAQSRAALHLEVLALRHQLQVLQRTRPRRVRLATADRWLWVWLSRVWTEWRTALVIVKPETVIAWHRHGFRLVWTWKSRRRTGRPTVPRDVRTLIRTMSEANPLWGAPRIHGELLKLGIARLSGDRREIHGAATAAALPDLAHVPDESRRPDRGRRFLRRPDRDLPPAVRPGARRHDRRRIVHVAVTAHPTAAWTAQQLREAFPWDQALDTSSRDRDHAFDGWAETAKAMGIEEVLTAPRSPWQNPFVERVIGSLRRECLDHVIVWNERSLRRHLEQYLAYYHEWRTHLSLDKDAPVSRAVQPPTRGRDRSSPAPRRSASSLRTSRRLRIALAPRTDGRPGRRSAVVPPHPRGSRSESTNKGVQSSRGRLGVGHARHRKLLPCRWSFW